MVRRGAALMLAAALTLSACARPDARPEATALPPASVGMERITYETGPCFGACPVYRISVSSDGTGVFTGIRHTEVIGERKFTITPAQFLAFREQLTPYLPAEGERLYQHGTPLCAQVATDLPSVDILWSRDERRRKSSRLYFYYGCDMEKNAPLGEALGNAVDALPVGELIGGQP